MSNQGSDVIEANDRSVKIAKRALAITDRNLQAAKKALEVARKNVDIAQKECDQAKKHLKHAEQGQTAAHEKYDVVNLMSPNKGNVISEATKRMKYNADVPQVILGKENVLSEASGVKANEVEHRSNSLSGVIIEGCGIAQANGFYFKAGGCHRFRKKGQWEGNDVWLDLHVSFGWWYVSIWNTRIFFYKAKDKSSGPPTDGWEVLNPYGFEPPPKTKVTFWS